MSVKITNFEKHEVEQSCRRLADSFGWDVSFQHGAVQFSARGLQITSIRAWDGGLFV